MKKLYLTFALFTALIVAAPFAVTGCSTAPDQRVQTVQTLKIVGQSAKSSIDAAAQLLKQGSITVEQFQKVAALYDLRWQPAYSLAVAAAHSDLSSVADPSLIGLAAELAALVATLTSK